MSLKLEKPSLFLLWTCVGVQPALRWVGSGFRRSRASLCPSPWKITSNTSDWHQQSQLGVQGHKPDHQKVKEGMMDGSMRARWEHRSSTRDGFIKGWRGRWWMNWHRRSRLSNKDSTSFFWIPSCFLICFWLEVNYWWWYPISVSLIQKENPSGVVRGRPCSDDHRHLVTRTKTAPRKHTNNLNPRRPFWHAVSDHIIAVGYRSLYSWSPLVQVTGCRALMSKRILALTLSLSDWLGAPTKSSYRVQSRSKTWLPGFSRV